MHEHASKYNSVMFNFSKHINQEASLASEIHEDKVSTMLWWLSTFVSTWITTHTRFMSIQSKTRQLNFVVSFDLQDCLEATARSQVKQKLICCPYYPLVYRAIALLFHKICTAASPVSGKLLRSLFPWGMTTNWNVRRWWNFMQEILKTCFTWFCPTLYIVSSCQQIS